MENTNGLNYHAELEGAKAGVDAGLRLVIELLISPRVPDTDKKPLYDCLHALQMDYHQLKEGIVQRENYEQLENAYGEHAAEILSRTDLPLQIALHSNFVTPILRGYMDKYPDQEKQVA